MSSWVNIFGAHKEHRANIHCYFKPFNCFVFILLQEFIWNLKWIVWIEKCQKKPKWNERNQFMHFHKRKHEATDESTSIFRWKKLNSMTNSNSLMFQMKISSNAKWILAQIQQITPTIKCIMLKIKAMHFRS